MNKRQWRRWIGLCVSLFLLFFVWGFALHLSEQISREYTGVGIRIHSEPVSGNALTSAMQSITADDGITGITAWNRSEMTEIANDSIGAMATARIITVYGDMSAVCPMKLIRGGFSVTADATGCMIDQLTADALFRSTDVVGASLDISDHTYIVRGVVESQEPMVLIRDDAAGYTHLEMSCSDIERGAEMASTFLYRHSLADSYTIVEHGFYGGIVSQLASLPGWIIGAAILLLLVREAWRRRAIPLQLLLLCITVFALYYLFFWLLDFSVEWPVRYLPTRWSDFAFWPELIETESAALEVISYLTPVPKDMQWASDIQALIVTIVAAAVIITAMIRNTSRTGYCPPLLAIICMAAAFATLYVLDIGFMPTLGYMLALPLWWIFISVRRVTIHGLSIIKKYQQEI